MPNTVAIIVTYNPKVELLQKVINSIINQISYCIIIDNGNTVFEFNYKEKLEIINLSKNYGIAYAQNRGIEYAIKLNADFIVLSDQDTVFPFDYMAKNISAYHELRQYKLAALVPVFFNSNKNAKSPVMSKKFSRAKEFSVPYIETAQAIASGSFIPIDTLKKIGYMNEKLFIDYVDFEWCWRATMLGYKIFTISSLVIYHQLGDRAKNIFNIQVTIRNPIRYFYMIRNGYYLIIHSPVLTLFEKLLFLKRIFIHSLGIMIIEHNTKSIQLIGCAMFEGISGRMKHYDEITYWM
jgi:rhamnosyltransferase